jgi:hypothetical protein
MRVPNGEVTPPQAVKEGEYWLPNSPNEENEAQRSNKRPASSLCTGNLGHLQSSFEVTKTADNPEAPKIYALNCQ